MHPPIDSGRNILRTQQIILASRRVHIILLWRRSS